MSANSRLIKVVSFCLILCVFLFSCTTAKKKEGSKNEINGMIYDFDNKPASMYSLEIPELGMSTVSDVTGRFSFSGVPFGTYTIKGSGKDFESVSETFSYYDSRQIIYLKAASRDQLCSMVYSCLEEERPDEAEKYLERLFNADKNDETALFYSAVIAFRKNETEKALETLLKLEKISPRIPEVYLFAAGLYEYRLNDKKKALEYLNKAYALSKSAEILERINSLKESAQ